jgi:hypothetical protein
MCYKMMQERTTVKKMKREPGERELMKTLSLQLKQMLDKISRALADSQDACRSWLDAAASKLFPVPAPVRVANRPQRQSPIRRRP